MPTTHRITNTGSYQITGIFDEVTSAGQNIIKQTSTGSVQIGGIFDEISIPGSFNFAGSPSYLSVPYTSAFDFGNGDFTVEFWMYTSDIATAGIMAMPHNASNYAPILFYGANSTSLTLYSSSNGTAWDVAGGANIGTIKLNSWNHVAVSKSGSSIRLFLNGILGNTVTFAGTFTGTYDRVWIGATANNSNFSGRLSNIRVVKGSSQYTSNFTPPINPVSTTTGTVLLLTPTGLSPFTDSSTSSFTITSVGAPIYTGFSPFAVMKQTNTGSIFISGVLDEYFPFTP